MINNAVICALSVLILSSPLVGAQSAFNSTADTGESGELHSSAPTNTQYPEADGAWSDGSSQVGVSQPTSTQGAGRKLNLPPVVTGMPYAGTKTAPGSLALKATGQTELPQTSTAILSDGEGGAVAGAEQIVGDEGRHINGYSNKNALVNIMSPDLTTNHQTDGPAASSGY